MAGKALLNTVTTMTGQGTTTTRLRQRMAIGERGDDLDHDEQTQISSATDSHSDKTRGGGRIGGSSGLLSREEKSDLKTQPASVSSVFFLSDQWPNLRSWHLRNPSTMRSRSNARYQLGSADHSMSARNLLTTCSILQKKDNTRQQEMHGKKISVKLDRVKKETFSDNQRSHIHKQEVNWNREQPFEARQMAGWTATRTAVWKWSRRLQWNQRSEA
ncbi:uncharacterized protein DS421_12g377440 [Arachis hypogaea]|nr:uncharacterized protein DS421_12g377440 [Arachis hypogaea]